MKQQTQEQRQAERDQQNTLLRTYGYHWKRTEQLTPEQVYMLHEMFFQMDVEEPQWVLLSPLEMPVDKETILRWLGKHDTNVEGVRQFLHEHGFLMQEKDEQNRWRIQTPSGESINLKQALIEMEKVRREQILQKGRDQEQKRKELFEQSTQSLKETLDIHGEAMNERSAWGYSPYPIAKRLADGTVEVTTYQFESEWSTEICQNESEVVGYLYSDGEGYWEPGTWGEPS